MLPDGSHLLVPAAWTDLEGRGRAARGRDAGSLEDLLAARRVLDRMLEAVVTPRRREMPSWPSAMIVDARTGSMQLRLDLAESPAPAAALWELVGEEQRQTAMALLAALIAQSVVGEPEGDEPMVSCDELSR